MKFNKEVTKDVERRLKFQFKKAEGLRRRTNSSVRALKVRKPSMEKKKIMLQRNLDPPFDYCSDDDEFDFDWSNFLNRRVYFLEEFGED